MKPFELVSDFVPSGDQPKAISALAQGIEKGRRSQVLLGVTGSGKTFTIANVIQNVQKPTLVLVHNKTLAAQLYDEFCYFFPRNAVEYFVSYYDYYQPEAYVARNDTYIEKSLSINDQVDQLRLRTTKSLLERRDVIVVASVSCIYGLGVPQHFVDMRRKLCVGDAVEREQILNWFVQMQYERKEGLGRGSFRVKGDTIDIVPAYEQDKAIRIRLFGNEIESLFLIDPVTGALQESLSTITLYPASHYVSSLNVRESAVHSIRGELERAERDFLDRGFPLHGERLRQRTCCDIEMILQLGYCKGVENYSRHFDGRAPGDPPSCLVDYFPSDFLLVVDESHQTIPQVRAMYHGDRSRKETLVSYGFRLPSAFDNRPLRFEEFYQKINQVIYVSATPGEWELQETGGEMVEQIIRPTGLIDPVVEVRPAVHQVDDVIAEVKKEVRLGRRVLVTTLTKKLSEELAAFFRSIGIKSEYMHADIGTLDRVHLLSKLRKGGCDVLVGVNLLREGLDLPEVGLVAVLDADREGFLRSSTSLVQISGRAARNVDGRVIMYANEMTPSIQRTLAETSRRRTLQMEYNNKHGISPKTTSRQEGKLGSLFRFLPPEDLEAKKERVTDLAEARKLIKAYERAMKKASKQKQYEEAARYRDLLRFYQKIEMRLVEDGEELSPDPPFN
ncbi:excinuclease ABC subunit UvrB [Candidatus Similichlamydia laticola]|uniref:UvrABC system protein B n=1 Tax=Candidatus Similichlamydia laticola TaxID=2170265 RepID=A0A369KBH5_9BACT|nr:excinuclease ABC subunit UvrB [Candidatus Similichlamydia laticola]RDB31268.1 Excinuclease ABC subunit B [Candidatus Similichlamydia laticola]